jgi:formylglycine-generating enzyme required for sulfatase activity
MNLGTRFASLILCWTLFVYPAFAQTPTSTPFPDFLLDLNQDGVIDSKDLLILIQKWGLEGIAAPTPTPTPTNPHIITVDLDYPPPLPLRLVRIPAGSFMMGSPDTERSRGMDEGPVHQVTIGNDFYLGETEVTQAQWAAVMGSSPPGAVGADSNYAVNSVSWNDCQEFLVALNALGRGTFRLPSEAEWEYACRAGTTTRFYFGNSTGCNDQCANCEADLPVIGGKSLLPHAGNKSSLDLEAQEGIAFLRFRSDYMWYCGNGEGLIQRVRQRFANGFGLYDMAGNEIEWCQDVYHDNYTGAPNDGSPWESGGTADRVTRGGSRLSGASACRSAGRFGNDPAFRIDLIGFRLARTP